MKLVQVRHIRCEGYEGDVTWCVAPDDWGEGRLEHAVLTAQENYLAAVRTANEKRAGEAPPYPGHMPHFAAHPDRLVREVQAEWEERRAAYDEFQERYRKAAHRFEDFLKDQGLTTLWGLDADTFPGFMRVEADWGHRHGVPLDYGTESDSFPPPAKLAGLVEDGYGDYEVPD